MPSAVVVTASNKADVMIAGNSGKYVAPDEGNLYRRMNDMFVKVTAQDTGGAYEVCEERCPAGFASRRHVHTQNHETFFVIEGSGTFEIGGEVRDGKQGDLFHIPAGTAHQVKAGSQGIRMLMVYSPGQTEAMFQDMMKLTPEERADFEIGKAVAARHNTIWLSE
jgi:quercetin dioxygenase-like cupin family protein